MMFPNALKAMRKLSPRTAPLSPNTLLKNRVATVVPELTRSYLDTAEKNATLANMYRT